MSSTESDMSGSSGSFVSPVSLFVSPESGSPVSPESPLPESGSSDAVSAGSVSVVSVSSSVTLSSASGFVLFSLFFELQQPAKTKSAKMTKIKQIFFIFYLLKKLSYLLVSVSHAKTITIKTRIVKTDYGSDPEIHAPDAM